MATLTDLAVQIAQDIKATREAPVSTAGMKTVPLALGLGFGNDYGAPAACTYRIPINYAPDIPRFRIHIRNVNPRVENPRSGSANFNGIWYGPHAGDGAFTATPAQIVPPFTTPANGDEWVSDWISVPIGGGTDYLLSFAYTYSGTPRPYFTAGGSWRDDTNATLGGATAPSSLVRENLIPFDIWLEAETYATTPVIAGFGDSLTAGIGADFTVYDSWVSQYARTKGALPVHYAIGGTTMDKWANEGFYAWRRWVGMSRPDAVVWGMGGNDIFGGATLAEAKARHAAAAPTVQRFAASRIYAATIMPRNGPTGSVETVRRQYNDWLRTLPNGVSDVFDFASSISGDDETIDPGYNSDGTHLNAAGYAQNAAAINRPIVAPSLATNLDTGVIDITAHAANITGGTLTFQHRNGWNVLRFANVQPVVGNNNLFGNNNPHLAPWAPLNEAGDVFESISAANSRNQSRSVLINYLGAVRTWDIQDGDLLNGSIVWPMNRPLPA